MRIPLAGNISTKDGAANKNSRLYNVLAETRKDGKVVAGVRPGLSMLADSVGNGNGVVCFNGTLISVFGAELGYPVLGEYRYDTTTGTIADTMIGGTKFGNNYIVRSEMAIYTTSDLSTFTYYDPDGLEYYSGDVVAGDSICLSGYTDEMDETYVLSWDTGMNLTVTPYSSGIYFPKAYGAGKFVANVSSTKTATSSDGISWTLGSDMTLPEGAASLFSNDIQYNGSVFCRISLDGGVPYQNVYSYSSSDGLVWDGPHLVAIGESVEERQFAAINGYGFIYSQDGICKISTDGESWVEYQLTDSGFVPNAIGYDETLDLICMVGRILDVFPTYTYHTIFSDDKGATWMGSADANNYTAVVPTGGGFALFKHGGNVSVISNVTNLGEITNIDSLVDAPIDFALIP